ncbi:hypothetical protein [Planctomycetes bacterium K23_9]|uniref:Uncharacterized protein n=1 Tax=Stieleria marina TaxID=1930275 RepID=A0A517NVR3_9BACT|nr:hypothetical protein K239x_32160 [Planctomycetes bacterium K23_9]
MPWPASIALICITVSMFATLLLELWTGLAVAGWAGDFALVDRQKQPIIYWAIMLLQISSLVVTIAVAYYFVVAPAAAL